MHPNARSEAVILAPRPDELRKGTVAYGLAVCRNWKPVPIQLTALDKKRPLQSTLDVLKPIRERSSAGSVRERHIVHECESDGGGGTPGEQ